MHCANGVVIGSASMQSVTCPEPGAIKTPANHTHCLDLQSRPDAYQYGNTSMMLSPSLVCDKHTFPTPLAWVKCFAVFRSYKSSSLASTSVLSEGQSRGRLDLSLVLTSKPVSTEDKKWESNASRCSSRNRLYQPMQARSCRCKRMYLCTYRY